MTNTNQSTARSELLAQLADLDKGDGTLGIVIDHALRDDPAVTADEIRAIWADATEDAAAEAAR